MGLDITFLVWQAVRVTTHAEQLCARASFIAALAQELLRGQGFANSDAAAQLKKLQAELEAAKARAAELEKQAAEVSARRC